MKFQHKLLSVAIVLALVAGCSKPDIDDHGLTDNNLNAEFTVTPVAGSANRYILAAKDSSYVSSKWDLDDGADAIPRKHSMEVFLPDAGAYNIVHVAVGKGGSTASVAKQINVATSDPQAGNLVQGGKFATADEAAKWTKLEIGSAAVAWNWANGKMVVSGGNGGHSAIYQAIQVQANKDYRFGMIVSGSGATDTWFEVYFGTDAPVQKSDYSSGGTRIGLNTWAGCGKSAFKDNIVNIGCAGDLKASKGVIRFATSGTVYLVIKCGGSNLGTTGISIDNVELRPVI